MVGFRHLVAALSVLLGVTSAQSIVRITPLGDSLTGGPGCWRALLWQRLQNAGITNTDFVGTQPAGGCSFAFDGEHEGHGGFKATGIVSANQLPGWLAVSNPDVVMMMLGTNDVWNSIPTADIITALSTLVDQMRAQKAGVRVLVAKIPPMNPGGCAACDWPGKAKALGDAIAVWAPTKNTAASPVSVVDCWTGFVAADFSDGVHMTDSGTVKLADCWEAPVKAAVLAAGGGSGSTTSRVSPTTTLRTSTTAVVSSTTTRASSTTTRIVSSTTRISSSTTTLRTTTPVLTTSRSSTTTIPGGAPLWGQCGGNGWAGPFTCAAGTCKYSNEWYSQCLP